MTGLPLYWARITQEDPLLVALGSRVWPEGPLVQAPITQEGVEGPLTTPMAPQGCRTTGHPQDPRIIINMGRDSTDTDIHSQGWIIDHCTFVFCLPLIFLGQVL